MAKTKIALVSYLNTIPFVKGLELADDFEIQKNTPAQCAEAFIAGDVDIALLPVGSLQALPPHTIITNYCIGCTGPVRTVVLCAHSPLDKISRVYLDEDSRTSARLVRVLLGNEYEGDYVNGLPAFPNTIAPNEAVLLIGDKVFEYENGFEYKMDLGESWIYQYKLPFVFAVWVCKPAVPHYIVHKLNQLLADGIAWLDAIDQYPNTQYNIDLEDYFKVNISYEFDEAKREALRVFCHKIGYKIAEADILSLN